MRKIFITGVSRGFGLALAQLLQSKGNEVIGFARSQGAFEGAFHSCDLSKPELASETLNGAFEQANLKEADSITFINNAGQLGPLDFIDRLSPSDIQENLSTNLIGGSIALSQFLGKTKNLNTRKLFVNISSGAALPDRAKPGWSLYCAAKAGMDQLIRTAATEQEHAAHPAKLINFNPGVMETAMQELIRSTPADSFPGVQRFIDMKEQGEVAEPSYVATTLAKGISRFDLLQSGKTYSIADFDLVRTNSKTFHGPR